REEVSQDAGRSVVGRNFDADRRFARNAINAHGLGLERKAEIVAKARNPGILHAGLRFELEGRDNRSRMDLLHGAGNFEFAGFFFEHARPLAKFVLVYRESGGRSMEKRGRSEEHTSELQSPDHLVCRLLLEK